MVQNYAAKESCAITIFQYFLPCVVRPAQSGIGTAAEGSSDVGTNILYIMCRCMYMYIYYGVGIYKEWRTANVL